MKPLTVKQLNNPEIDFNTFYNNLRWYGVITKVIEIDIVTHTKFFEYKNNYFYVKMHKGEVFEIGTTYKNIPDYNSIEYRLKH